MSTKTPPSAAPPSTLERILADADRCVLCGLCLPHCPTYGLRRDEAESPRGRISLVQALARGSLTPDRELARHLDACLHCRACEDMCPSGVPYGRLIDAGLALLPAERRPGDALTARLLGDGHLPLLLGLYRGTGLRLLERAGARPRTALLDRRLPHRWPSRLPALTPAHGAARGEVALFVGCTGRGLDMPALQAALWLLPRLGYSVHIPPDQGCCGALERHRGDRASADARAAHNHRAFPPGVPIVTVASGCTGAIDPERARDGDNGTYDLSGFLERAWDERRLPLAPLPWRRVAVHDPCSLRRVRRGHTAVYRLLEQIPRLEITPLAGNDRCCGGAGLHALSHREDARALRAPKLEALAQAAPEILVTSNIGCALHLAEGAAESGLRLAVAHPAELLALAALAAYNSKA